MSRAAKIAEKRARRLDQDDRELFFGAFEGARAAVERGDDQDQAWRYLLTQGATPAAVAGWVEGLASTRPALGRGWDDGPLPPSPVLVWLRRQVAGSSGAWTPGRVVTAWQEDPPPGVAGTPTHGHARYLLRRLAGEGLLALVDGRREYQPTTSTPGEVSR